MIKSVEFNTLPLEAFSPQVQERTRSSTSSGSSSNGTTFLEMFKESVDKVNSMQINADHAIKDMIAGRTKNVHETMLAIEQAESSFKLMMQVRNKMIEAYREIMRMQV